MFRWGVASRSVAILDVLVAGVGAAVRMVATNHYRRPRPRLQRTIFNEIIQNDLKS